MSVTREELGLRPAATAYWCAQSLFKYLPQHDEVFPRIAREAGDCQFVFIRHFGQRRHRAVRSSGSNAPSRRPASRPRTIASSCNAMDMSRFAAASAQCDVMLDSIGWSGGNTTLEALAQDLPVVTFEGALMRGRVSAGMLRMMGMPETIADDRRLCRARGPHGPGQDLPGGVKGAYREGQASALSRSRLHCRA